MPKVEYTVAKGLFQSSGSGFEVTGADMRPSLETKQRQKVTVADPGLTGANVNGKYFNVFNATQRVVVWYQSTDNASPASQPAVGQALYIKIAVIDADAKTVVASKTETQLEAASVGLVVDDGAGNGSFIIEGDLPYAAAGTASAGTIGSAVAQAIAGSGNNTNACETFGITVLGEDASAYEAAPTYTLGSGAHVGQQKTIIRTTDDNTDITLTVAAGYQANGQASAGRTFVFGHDTDAYSRNLTLLWDGTAWEKIFMSAGVTIDT